MIRINTACVGLLAISSLLAGCNSTGINPNHPRDVSSIDSRYLSVQVFNKRADLPRGSKILGKITAQNKLPDGAKASPEAIVDELKRQALLLGGNGVIFVTPGSVQTHANAVLVPTQFNY